MAKLTLSIEIPAWTVDDLKQAVVALDGANSKPEDAIFYENVRAEHVLEAIMNGDLGVNFETVEDAMED